MNLLEQLLFKRPRALNYLHAAGLASATSQTIACELDCLRRYAKGALSAVEIGSYQGVSAASIAEALSPQGKLCCIDPWPAPKAGRENPCLRIFRRHLKRRGMWERIVVMHGYSAEFKDELPTSVDFIFVDGDHSFEGISEDWKIVASTLRVGGIACLHDTVIPATEPWRTLDSVEFFNSTILSDKRFRLLEQVHSMSVLARLA